MAVAAISKYEFAPPTPRTSSRRPTALHRLGRPSAVLCALRLPVPPSMRFGDVVAGPMRALLGYHPDFAQIDWAKAEMVEVGQAGHARLRQVAGRERAQAQGRDPFPAPGPQRHQGLLQLNERAARQVRRAAGFTAPNETRIRTMSYELTIEPIGQTIEVEDDQTILDAALRAGIWLPHACCHGLCATCKVQVVDGEVDHGEASGFA